MKRHLVQWAAVATVGALALTGCGRESDGEDGAAAGVTSEPCPDAVDDSKGCIYLGAISDLTGLFKGVGVPYTEGQKAFWKAVNEDGGIGDYEVNITENTRDNEYNPDTAARVYGEIEGDILALAQSLGTAQTNAFLSDAKDDDIVVVPASLGSNWLFEDQVLEVGTNYCAEAMNIVDYAVDELDAKRVAAVHFPGDYGDDAAVGARTAAEARDVEFTDVVTAPGSADAQAPAIKAILKSKADVVVVSTGPIELASIVGGAAQAGFTGTFIGSVPTWNSALLVTPAKAALQASYLQASSAGPWGADTDGHKAMREAAGDTAPNDWYTAGWASSYVLKAVLEKAIEDDNLTREGVVEAATSLESVDTQGMFPEGTGNYAGDANDAAVRLTQLNRVDPKADSGVSTEVDYFAGPTVENHDFSEACYLQK